MPEPPSFDRLPCFAYGANLDPAAMQARAPRSRPLGPAAAPGWRFVIASSGWASLEPAEGMRVEGLLWEIHAGDLPALDRFEGIDEGLYEKRPLEVVANGAPLRAWAYFERAGGRGSPDERYLDAILAAARRLGFSAEYLREIESWKSR